MSRSSGTPRHFTPAGIPNQYDAPTSTSINVRLRGLFKDGAWFCDCEPRKQAIYLQAKKTKNRGRWFYKCRNSPKDQCDFFIWEDDAVVRQGGAPATADQAPQPRAKKPSPPAAATPRSIKEWARPTATPAATPAGGDPVQRRLFPAAAKKSPAWIPTPVVSGPSTRKRKRVAFAEDQHDETGSTTGREGTGSESGDDSDDFAMRLVEIADSVEKAQAEQGSEPHAQSALATPTPVRTYDVDKGIATPMSHIKAVAQRDTPAAKRQRLDDSSIDDGIMDDLLKSPEDLVPPAQGSLTTSILEKIPAGAVPDVVRQDIYQQLFSFEARNHAQFTHNARDAKELRREVVKLRRERDKDQETIARLRAAVAALASTA